MAALPQTNEIDARPQLRLVEGGKREQERARCPICKKLMAPSRSNNGIERRACTPKCKQALRRREAKAKLKASPEFRTRAIILSMSKSDLFDYELEGCTPVSEALPLLPTGWIMEDTDPTPVPKGCAECFLTGGNQCITCPSSRVSAGEITRRRKEHFLA